MYETSEASEDLDELLKDAGLTESSDDGLEKPPISIYGGKQPKAWIKRNIDNHWRELQKEREEQANG